MEATIEQVANAWLLPRAAAKHALAAPGWLAWLPVAAAIIISGALVSINIMITSEPLRVACAKDAERAKSHGEYPPETPTCINGYPLPYISDAASADPGFTTWRIGLSIGSLVMIFVYLTLVPIYPAVVAPADPLPTTAAEFSVAQTGWRVACALSAVSFALLLVVANTRAHMDARQDVLHRTAFSVSFCIFAVAEPLLTASGRRFHRGITDGPGAWLTWIRAALWLTLVACGCVLTLFLFLQQAVHHALDYSTVEYVGVGAVIAFQLSIDVETRAVVRWLGEQRATPSDALRSTMEEEAQLRKAKSERDPLVATGRGGGAAPTDGSAGMRRCMTW